MHGMIHSAFIRFIEFKFGTEVKINALENAALTGHTYLPIRAYPDQELVGLIGSVTRTTGEAVPDLLQDFGEYLTPMLLQMYRALIRPEWKTVELLLNVEGTIHKIVRLQHPGAAPPRVKFELVRENQLRFYYTSARNLPDLAIGLIKGVARHYGEEAILLSQTRQDRATEMLIEINPFPEIQRLAQELKSLSPSNKE